MAVPKPGPNFGPTPNFGGKFRRRPTSLDNLPPVPPRRRPDYTLCVVRFVTRAGAPFSPERGEARLVRVDRGPGRGWRPLVFWTREKAEAWLDARWPRRWRECLDVVEISRAEWERLVVTEGLIPSNARQREAEARSGEGEAGQ